MNLLTASAYLLTIAFLFGSAIYVWSRNPSGRINWTYAALCLTLLGWVGSLFLFGDLTTPGPDLLRLGRENFAAAALMTPACLLFVRALADLPRSRYTAIFTAETILVALLSLLTPLVDKAESISGGLHVTTYGPLFVLYVLHVIGYIVAAIWIAFADTEYYSETTRAQLRLVGTGILVTAIVAFITNAVLPYAFDNFSLIHFGTLATIAFLASISYAIATKRLFDIRVIVTNTLVYGILIAIFIELYAAAVDGLTALLPLGDQTSAHLAAAAIAFTINAVTKEPLERMLQTIIERLFPRRRYQHIRR